jgi:hypothetical protein
MMPFIDYTSYHLGPLAPDPVAERVADEIRRLCALYPVEIVPVTVDEHYRLRKLEDQCGVPGYTWDDAAWEEGVRQILGSRCPENKYATCELRVVKRRDHP